MTSKRPRIEGYAIVSREGMIAKSDGSFPEELKIPADQQFYQESLERASAVANGRHSAEGGPREKARKRILLTRRVQRLIVHPDNPNVVQWNPGTASFEEAWHRLGIEDGILVVNGQPVTERYLDQSRVDGVYYGPVTVAPGCVFMLGDNRANSVDSRTFGPVPAADLVGRVELRLWPPSIPH